MSIISELVKEVAERNGNGNGKGVVANMSDMDSMVDPDDAEQHFDYSRYVDVDQAGAVERRVEPVEPVDGLTMFDEDAFEHFIGKDGIVEVRIMKVAGKGDPWLGYAKSGLSGYFNDFKQFSSEVSKYVKYFERHVGAPSARHTGYCGTYMTVHEIPADVADAYEMNVMRVVDDRGVTKDAMIDKYRWLFIDIDPIRDSKMGSKVSSSNAEWAAARGVVSEITEFLHTHNFPEPTITCSGNGWHIYYPFAVEVNDEWKLFYSNVLRLLRIQHNSAGVVDVDRTITSPGQLTKLYGSKAVKGKNSPERPHRTAYIEALGSTETDVEAYRAFAGFMANIDFDEAEALVKAANGQTTPETKKAPGKTKGKKKAGRVKYSAEEFKAFLDENGIKYHAKPLHDKATTYVLKQCIYDPAHNNNEGYFIQDNEGGFPVYKCQHATCPASVDKAAGLFKNVYKHITGEDFVVSGYTEDSFRLNGDIDGVDDEGGLPVPGVDRADDRDYIRAMNDRYATIAMSKAVKVMITRPDKVNGGYKLQYISAKDLVTEERGLHPIEVDEKYKNPGEVWLDWEHRRRFTDVVFKPDQSKVLEGEFNMFTGWNTKPDPNASCAVFLKHIYEAVAGGNKEIGDYIMAWLADVVKNPGGPLPGVAVILRGGEGSGKSCISRYLGKMMGRYYTNAGDKKEVLGRFNSHLAQSLFCFVDEGKIGAFERNALYTAVTEGTRWIESKGVDAVPVDNFTRLMIASNEETPIPAGPGARRFLACDVLDTFTNDEEHFKAFFAEIDNGGPGALMHYLLTTDFSHVNLRKAPKTAALLEQILSGMSIVHKFWYARLQDGETFNEALEAHVVGMDNIADGGWKREVSTAALYQAFSNFCQKSGMREIPVPDSFGRSLKKICSGLKKVRKMEDGVRLYLYSVPALEDCRAEFSALLKMDIIWDEEV